MKLLADQLFDISISFTIFQGRNLHIFSCNNTFSTEVKFEHMENFVYLEN